MKCLTKEQINRLANNTVSHQDRLQWLLHIQNCDVCRAKFQGDARLLSGSRKIANAVLQVEDCPEYETLSSFLDGDLNGVQLSEFRAHLNTCEYCQKDLATMQSVRAQSLLREPVSVSAKSPTRESVSASIWTWVFGTSSVAVAAGFLIAVVPMLNRAPNVVPVAQHVPKPSVTVKDKPAAPMPAAVEKLPEQPTASSVPLTNIPSEPAKVAKAPDVVLTDGDVRIVRKDGKLQLQFSGKGSSAEKLVSSYIEDKLRTGKVKIEKPVVLAKGSIVVRSEQNTGISLAPKLSSPVGKVLISAQPLLEWSIVDLAQDYQVTVTDSDGRVVYETITVNNRVKINLPLDRGKVYQWRVACRFSDESEWDTSPAAAFKVISDEDMKLIEETKKQFGNSKLAMGVVYESLQLEDEADREYKNLTPHARGIEILRSLNGK